MKHIAVLGSALLILGASAVVGQEKLSLKRSYKVDEKCGYSLEIKSTGTPEFTIKGVLLTKVLAVKDTTAELETTLKGLTVEGLPAPGDSMADEVKKVVFDKKAMPENLGFNESEACYVVHSLMSVLPDQEVAKDGVYKINWTSKDSKVTFSGDGKLVEVGEKGSVKAFKVKKTIEVDNGEGQPGKVSVNSWHAVDDGRLLEGEGTIEIEGMTINISMKPAKN